ncbi:MAG: nucleotidyltransferase domain-containing protein [Spirochaetia bacterium]
MKSTYVDYSKEELYKEKIKNEVLRLSTDFKCTIYLFGSRAKGIIKRSSDFDIGISGLENKQFSILYDRLLGLEDKLNIPHKIEIVNLDVPDKDFLEKAMENVEVWKQS